MARKSVLIVEDEEDIAELMQYNLERDGFETRSVASGEEVLGAVHERRPDLILLDLMLPGVDGLEVCRRLRSARETRAIPLMMVTARGEEADIVTGLELGADDYLTKPFSPRVLVARARALTRRKRFEPVDEEQPLTAHGIEIHPGRHEVRVGGEAVELTATEFKLLHFLAKRPGWVFTRYQIVDAVRGADYPVTERSIDVQVVGLRKKLGEAADILETVRGVGYRFRE